MSVGYPEFPEFFENYEPRCPVVLLLDTSSSMQGAPIQQLNRGLVEFKASIEQDSLAALRVEVAIITFGPVRLEQDFVTMSQFSPPILSAHGVTPMTEAIEYAINLVEDRKETYRNQGVDYYRPWIFLITDGAPTDNNGAATDSWKRAAQRVRQSVEERKLIFFCVAVESANINVLREISPVDRPPLRLRGLDFSSLFVWLSKSVSRVSSEKPGTGQVDLPPINWGSVPL